jgi:hypothetical protein
MSHWLDQGLVGILLAASAGYAFMALGPKAWRRKVLDMLARAAGSAPHGLRLTALAHKMQTAAAAKPKGACGGCEDCASNPSSSAQASPAEIKIPVGKIGRRV